MSGQRPSWSPFGDGKCRISDEWTYKGLRTVILENDLLRVVILVDRGSDIIEFRYKPYDVDFLLRRPRGIRTLKMGALDLVKRYGFHRLLQRRVERDSAQWGRAQPL